MNPTVEKLILQIVYVCLHINTQGKWHAHVNLAAHVRQVAVYILPATQIYAEGEPHVRAFEQGVYYQAVPGRGEWSHERAQSAEPELLAMLAALEAYLEPANQEAAA